MKKALVLLLAILITTLASAQQPQRLALLPSIMQITENGGSYIPSLCIDYFRKPPTSRNPGNYTNFGNADGTVPENLNGLKFDAIDYRRPSITKEGLSINPDILSTLFLSTAPDLNSISAQKIELINLRINFYKNTGAFDEVKLDKLQSEVWAYDILEKLGYIKSNEPVEAGFNNAKANFANDFLSGDTLNITDNIRRIGEDFKYYFEEGSTHQFRISKNSVTKDFSVFHNISPPIYKGMALDELVSTFPSNINPGEAIEIKLDGFNKNDEIAKEKAFLLNMHRKLGFKYSKDILLITERESIIWYPEKYSVSKAFNMANIKSETIDGEVLYNSSIDVKSTDARRAKLTLTIEAQSNKRKPLSSFFIKLTERIETAKEAITLSNLNREIKKQVMEAEGLKGNDFINVIISSQGEIRAIVKIRKNNISIITNYASYASR